MAREISARELAELLDVSAKTICEWAASGIVVRVGHGRYDLRESFRAFARHARARHGLTDAEIEEIRADLEWSEEQARRHPSRRVVKVYEFNENARSLDEMHGRLLGTIALDPSGRVVGDFEPEPL